MTFNRPPRICIAVYSNPGYKNICDLTNPNKQAYANRMGYTFLHNVTNDSYGEVFFNRHRWYLELIGSSQWDCFLAVDGDVIFTNFNIALETFLHTGHSIVLAKDAHGLQAGMILFVANKVSVDFLEKVVAQSHRFKPGSTSDQDIIEELVPEFRAHIRFLPQREFQSYDYSLYADLGGNYMLASDADGNDGQWQPGDFAFHVPAVMEKKIEVLRKHLEQVKT